MTLLIAALTLHWAVGLIEQDWPWLVGIGAVVLVTISLTAAVPSGRLLAGRACPALSN